MRHRGARNVPRNHFPILFIYCCDFDFQTQFIQLTLLSMSFTFFVCKEPILLKHNVQKLLLLDIIFHNCDACTYENTIIQPIYKKKPHKTFSSFLEKTVFQQRLKIQNFMLNKDCCSIPSTSKILATFCSKMDGFLSKETFTKSSQIRKIVILTNNCTHVGFFFSVIFFSRETALQLRKNYD